MVKRNSKNVYLLGGSSFFNDVGAEMITPILPLYITALGGSGIAVGLLSGLREGLASVFKILGGYFSDNLGKRKIFIWFGYIISSIFRLLLGIANSPQQILAFISFERFGKLRDAPRDAIIAGSKNGRGRGFGIHQMMDTAGGVLGTLLVIFLFWKFQLDFKNIIIIAAIIGSLSLLPLIFVKEPKIKPANKNFFSSIKELNKHLKYFIFVASIFTLANFGLYMFLILRAKQITQSTIIPLLLYALFSLTYSIFAIPFGNLSDKIGRKKVLIFGYILFSITSIGFIYSSNLMSLIILFSLFGLVYALTQSNQRALVADLSGKMKATALGTYYFSTGIINIPAGLIAGYLWNLSYLTMFSYTSIISLIALGLLLFVKEN
jgi:MFS family permease